MFNTAFDIKSFRRIKQQVKQIVDMSWKFNVLGVLLYFCAKTCYAITHTSDSNSQDTYSNALDEPQTEYGDADPNNLNTYSYSYQPPSNNYLPSAVHFSSTSAPVYQSFNYGPPAPYYNPIPNNVKFELHSYPQQYELIHPYQFLFTKLKAKLNIFTIGKLLLKLLIFKKIIKFIGIICLLLILPKLKHFVKDMSATTSIESTEIESRQFPLIESDILEQRINEVFNFAIEALQKF